MKHLLNNGRTLCNNDQWVAAAPLDDIDCPDCLDLKAAELLQKAHTIRTAQPVITNVPAGSRDLYWCWHLNEPVIIEYREGRSYCTNCRADLLGDAEEHTFILHVMKPNHKPDDRCPRCGTECLGGFECPGKPIPSIS
jgi:hypothetical protein